jgi:DNA-binding NtrC family response regulator
MFLRSFHWPGNVRQLKNVAERLVLRDFPRPIAVGDLPREITEDAIIAAAPATAVESGRPDRFDSLMRGESFWTAVHEPFMSRDLTRDDLRQLVRRGLMHTQGSYRQLTTLFNLPPTDYKSLLNFLRKHDCHVPYKPFRTISGGAVPTTPITAPTTIWTPNERRSGLPRPITKSA